MQWEEFTEQMGRIASVFGKNAYADERIKLIWREVKDLSPEWMAKTADHFIGEERQAPLLPQFRLAIAEERERLWAIEKKKHAQEAQKFFHSSYQGDDVRAVCQTIVKKVNQGMSDTEFASFVKMLSNVADSSPKASPNRECKMCGDSGVISCRDEENYRWIFRCRCSKGNRLSKNYVVYQQQ